MSQSMIERVSAAILSKVPTGYGMTEAEAEVYARAAIEAMREPTPEMRKAGQFRYRDIDLGNGTKVRGIALGDDPFSSYTKMIDAALQEPKP